MAQHAAHMSAKSLYGSTCGGATLKVQRDRLADSGADPSRFHLSLTLRKGAVMTFVQRSKRLRAGVAFYLMVGMLLVIPSSAATAAPQLCGGMPATIIGTSGDDLLKGTESDDVIIGLAGDDRLVGLGGNDTICGKDGDDILVGGPGDDVLLGGDGSDWAAFGDAPAVEVDLSLGTATGWGSDELRSIENLAGSGHADTLSGDNEPNLIRGNGGADHIRGRGGADELLGGPGDDHILGAAGDDVIVGHQGHDTLVGGSGDDELQGRSGDDTFIPGAGNDTITGGDGVDTISFGSAPQAVEVDLGVGKALGEGADTLAGITNVIGTRFADLIVGNAGPNHLTGLGGGDAIDGKSGDDTIDGSFGHDILRGGPGHDTLIGGDGRDQLKGADGHDELFGGGQADLVVGGELSDVLWGGLDDDVLRGGGGNDTIAGQAGDDEIDGGPGNDEILGGGGDDSVLPGRGDDTVSGGSGVDWVVYRPSSRAIRVNLTAGTASGSGSDLLVAIENVAGTSRGDSIRGDSRRNEIVGLDGDDLIHGGGAADVISGGRGSDDLWGDAGDDELYGWAGPDVIHGGFGDDVLVGGGGSDDLYGGGGTDSCWSGENYATCETIPETVWGPLPWPSLNGIRFADEVPVGLRAQLQSDGFVIAEQAYGRHMAPTYESTYWYDGRSLFVTTDAAYHHWHLVFDKILRDTEQDILLPLLEDMVLDLLAEARAQTAELAGTQLADPALRLEEYLEAVATVLELDVGPIGDRAAAEVQLVNDHFEVQASPTVGGVCPNACVDYSRMKPRGHYTRSAELTRYFKAMSMLGNIGFVLAQTDPFRVGLLLTRCVVTDPGVTASWERIYEATAVIVGAADDYTPFEADQAAAAIVPDWPADPAALASDTTVQAVADELESMRPVLIDPESASLRAMGVRFIFDSYVLDQLTHENVFDRVAPSALDVAAAFGSDWALERQHESDPTTTTAAYAGQMVKMRAAVEGRTTEDWNATVYDAWLLALQPSFRTDRSGSPPFMQTDEWQAKSHQSGFGSYAELKHDTILYGKEGTAEGDGPPPPPSVLHWVEPDPLTFERIAATATLFRDVLEEQDLLPDDGWGSLKALLDDFITMASQLGPIANRELEAGRPTDADSEWLNSIGGRLSSLLERTGDSGNRDPYGGIVADIFRNVLANEVLEEGTGEYDLIYVIVPDVQGFQVATGAVYSYYEFWQPRADRLTDEQWWEMIKNDLLPPRPFWVQEYLGL